jgi:ribulose-phosphate 3-epimerase
MIAPVDRYLEAFAKAGADVITVHAEAGPHLDRSLQAIRAMGKKAGVSLNPATPASVLKHVLDRLDLILVMTVNPGFGGQSFIPAMLDKISEVRDMVRGRAIDIEVDGGVTRANAAEIARAGANVLVAGSAIFKAKSYADEIKAIRTAATSVAV